MCGGRCSHVLTTHGAYAKRSRHEARHRSPHERNAREAIVSRGSPKRVIAMSPIRSWRSSEWAAESAHPGRVGSSTVGGTGADVWSDETRVAFAAMAKLWLKPFGDSKQPVRKDWVNEFLRRPGEPLDLMTGPSNQSSPPAMRPGDRVALHAVGHGHVFAAGLIESGPRWEPGRVSGWDPSRWPWTYSCRIQTWVPRVFAGPAAWDFAARVKGQIQFGTLYAELSRDEYDALVAALGASRSALHDSASSPR